MVAARLIGMGGRRVFQRVGASLLATTVWAAPIWLVHAPDAHAKAGQFADSARTVTESRPPSGEPRWSRREFVVRPSVLEFTIDADGFARVSGSCAPTHAVHIRLDGRLHRSATCDLRGRFESKTLNALGAGVHILSTSVRLKGGRERLGHDVRVYIPPGYQGETWNGTERSTSAENEFGSRDPRVISQDIIDEAEELAHAASERFGELMEGSEDGPMLGRGKFGARDKSVLNDVAQLENDGRADSQNSMGDDNQTRTKSIEDSFGLSWIYKRAYDANTQVQDWFTYSRESYDSEIVPELKSAGSQGRAGAGEVVLGDVPLPERPSQVWGFEGVRVDIAKYLEQTRQWMQIASDDYRSKILRPLTLPEGILLEAEIAGSRRDDRVVRAPVPPIQDPVVVDAVEDLSVSDRVSAVSPPDGRLSSEQQIFESRDSTQREKERLLRERQLRERDVRAAAAVPHVARDRSKPANSVRRIDRSLGVAGRYVAPPEGVARIPQRDVATAKEAKPEPEPVKEPRSAAAGRDTSERAAKTLPRVVLAPRVTKPAATTRESTPAPEKRPRATPSTVRIGSVLPPRKPFELRARGRVQIDDEDSRQPSRADVEQRSSLAVDYVVGRKPSARKAVKRATVSRVRHKPRARRAKARKKKRRVAVRAYRKRRTGKRVKSSRRSRKGRVYVVRKGDSLWKIAKRHYGDGKCYKAIARANSRKVSNPNLIIPRQRLVIPRLKRR